MKMHVVEQKSKRPISYILFLMLLLAYPAHSAQLGILSPNRGQKIITSSGAYLLERVDPTAFFFPVAPEILRKDGQTDYLIIHLPWLVPLS